MATTLYTIKDIVNAIKNNYTKSQEDNIISMLVDVATISGSWSTVSGTDIYDTISGTVSGTTYSGVWNETITSGTPSEIATWRLNNYRDVFTQAQRAMNQRVYFDSITTVSGREDMSTWDNLLDDDTSTGVSYTVSSDLHIELQKPTAAWTTAVRARVDVATAKAYFAYSENDSDWYYYSSASGSHTVSGTNLTKWDTEADAKTNYVALELGNNIMPLPSGIEGQYFRMYLTGSGYTVEIADFDWSNVISADDINAGSLNTSLVQISDSGGKMIISGSTIKIYNDNNDLIVELGELS